METETELRDEWLLSKKINTLSQCTYQTLPLHLNDADTWDVLCITYRPRMPSGTRNISSYMDICGWGVISERVKVAFLFRALQTPPRLNLGVKPQTVISSRVVRCMCKFGLCEWSKRQTTGSRSHSLQPEHFTLLVVGCVQSETAAEAADNQHKRASRRRLKTRGDLGLIETETAPVQNDSEFEPFRAKVSQSWAVKCFFYFHSS